MSEKTMSMEECLDCADEVVDALILGASQRVEISFEIQLAKHKKWMREVIAKFFDALPDEED